MIHFNLALAIIHRHTSTSHRMWMDETWLKLPDNILLWCFLAFLISHSIIAYISLILHFIFPSALWSTQDLNPPHHPHCCRLYILRQPRGRGSFNGYRSIAFVVSLHRFIISGWILGDLHCQNHTRRHKAGAYHEQNQWHEYISTIAGPGQAILW